MNLAEINEKPREEIRQVNDLQLLKAIYKLLSLEEQDVYHLNNAQISAIEEDREQYKRDEIFTNEDVDREMEEWLKK